MRACGSVGVRSLRGSRTMRKTSPISFCPEIPGSVAIRGQKWEFTLYPAEKIEIIPQKTYTKWFDYDKIKKCLEIRGRKPGDYLEINRAHGRKKLKAYRD